MNDLSAALADRYRVGRELGQGGMATVYLAHDVRHDRELFIVRNDSMIAVPVITTPAFAFGTPHALFSAAGLERWTALLSR
jgi:hypothetical protein